MPENTRAQAQASAGNQGDSRADGDLHDHDGQQDGEGEAGIRIAAAIEAIYKEAMKAPEANLPQEEILQIINGFSVLDRYNMLILMNQQMRFLFMQYQAETISLSPSPLHVAMYGVAATTISNAAEAVQSTIPGCTDDLMEASIKQAKALTFRVKSFLLASTRGRLILPPGVEGGPDKGN
jgi:hypothetical protein